MFSAYHLAGGAVGKVAHLHVVKYVNSSSLGLIFIGIVFLHFVIERLGLVINPLQLVYVIPIVIKPPG